MRILKRSWEWFDDLSGFSKTLGPVMLHAVPHARRTGWFYVFGSATLFAFALQIATGIALSTAYVTSTADAYNSLKFITDSPVGRVVRGIHYFGASSMIILIGVHTIRVYLFGSYKFPRQLNWLSGAALLLLTLGMAFTGQLLRWDQIGVWTSVIAAEQAGRAPVLGNWIGHFILAGDTVGGATLSRFFAAHVFFIPALIFAILGLHLYLVVYHGISEPPKAGRAVNPRTYRRWYRALLARDGEPFWPDAAWRDAVCGMLLVVAVVVVAVFVGPPELGKPPDPTIVEASPRPDWYFMWYFAVLSVTPRWLEDSVILLAPLIFGLILVALPFVAPAGERSPLRRPWAIGFVLLAMWIIGHYWALGNVAPWSPRLQAQPLPHDIVGATGGPISDGAKAFYQKGCEYCHLVSGYGGIRGPDLSAVGDRLNGRQMVTRIFSGATNMPSYTGNMTPDDLANIVAFLQSRTARHRTARR